MVYGAVNETIIRDIIDVVQDLRDRDEIDSWLDRRSGRSFSSITSKAKDLIMVFPVIGSSNMSYETAAMVCKATERKACILLDMLFSAANICDVDNAEEFVRQFHTNIKGKMTMDDFSKMMDKFVDENGIEMRDTGEYNKILRELSEMNCYFEESVRESSIDDFKFVKGAFNESTLVNTAVNEEKVQVDFTHNGRRTKGTVDVTGSFIDKMNSRADKETAQAAKNMSDAWKNDFTVTSGRILDTDIKKCNELAPTLMYVNFTYVGEDNYPVTTSALVGVKAKLYIADSEDIMDRLELKYADKNHMLNLVKVSTKEIKFFKDFLFAIDRAKIDAMSQSRRGSSNKMWKVLERRALKSKVRRAFSMTNDATAITTLVVTQEEVDYLRKTRYIDIENSRVITKIMDAYNMMGLCIVDEAMEIAKFLYDDGEGRYEVVTFDNLEREQRDNSKKIVNLMSKMSR